MNTNKLIEVLGVQSVSFDTLNMENYIMDFCDENNIPFINDNGNIYITKGDSINYPCVVAHTDTVHELCEDLTVINVNGNLTGFNAVLMEQTGIGGDDKVGIFIALQCLLKFDSIKIAFFRDEEAGCNGSYDADMDFFDNCTFVLQCDRKGNRDFITNASGIQLCGKDFMKDIKPILTTFKYKFENGMMTDVMALKEMGLKCSCANISCGYYNPHCYTEYVNIKDVSNCLNMVFNIIENLGGNIYFHTEKKKCGYLDYKKSKSNKNKSSDDLYEVCDSCGNISLRTQYSSSYNCFLCEDCNNSLDRWENEEYKTKVLQVPFNN